MELLTSFCKKDMTKGKVEGNGKESRSQNDFLHVEFFRDKDVLWQRASHPHHLQPWSTLLYAVNYKSKTDSADPNIQHNPLRMVVSIDKLPSRGVSGSHFLVFRAIYSHKKSSCNPAEELD